MIFYASDNSVYLLAIPLILGLMIWGGLSRRKRLAMIIKSPLLSRMVPSYSRMRQFYKACFKLMALTFILIALMRPQWGLQFEKIQRRGQDIFVLIDTSLSMQAQDVSPSRFDRAKREVLGLVDSLTGDRVGLIAFSGDAFIQCPLTLDYGAVKLFLDHLSVGQVPQPGTDIATAIKKARLNFLKKKTGAKKMMIIISDGESFENDPVESAKVAAKEGIQIYTIGVGTPSGEPLPLIDNNGVVSGYKKDEKQQVVLSRLNEDMMRQIALEGNGHYFMSSQTNFVSEQLYKSISKEEKSLLEEKLFQKHKERYAIFLLFAFVLLLLEGIISERKYLPKKKKEEL